MRRFLAFVLVLSMVLVGIPLVSEDVGADGGEYFTTSIYGSASDGSIDRYGAVDTTSTTSSALLYDSSTGVRTNAYFSFDMSSIPAGSIFIDAELKFTLALHHAISSTINIYSGYWGASLEPTDKGCGLLNGTLESSKSYVGNNVPVVFYVDVSPSSIGATMTQFEITETSYPNSVNVYMSESSASYRPLLTVTYRMGFSATYEYSDGTDGTYELCPSYVRYNNTHDVATVVFETWTGVNNVSLTKLPGWTHLSHIPIANSTTESDNYYNLTGVLPNLTYRVYFAVPVIKQTTVYVTAYKSDTGEGFAFETFRMVLNDGLTYDNTTAETIGSQTFTVDYGGNYTISALDYFGNVISSSPFVANALTKHVAIAINAHSFKTFNQRDDFIHVDIYYNGSATPISFYQSPMETVEKLLRDGTYHIIVGFYDNGTITEGQYFNRTINSSEYLMIEGTTITAVYEQVSDVLVYEQLITILVTPGNGTIYFRYYDATGTHPGEGTEWERYLCYVDGSYHHFDWFAGPINSTHTLVVRDFFGNELYNSTFSVDNAIPKLITIPINTYSFKVMNSQDYDPVKVKIVYGNSTTDHQFYLGAKEVNEKYFKPGNYTVTLIYHNNSEVSAPVLFYKTITDNATYLNIRGFNNVTELVEGMNGIIYWQNVITTLITPDVVSVGENLPSVPYDGYDPGIELVHPWSIIHGYLNGTSFTNETLFYYTYYTSQKLYDVTLTVNNTDGLDWTNVTWFIGFPENRSIAYSTVRVYDLNNDCYLVAGLHYDMTLTGIRMKWDTFNATLTRSFKITMYDANATDTYKMPIAYTNAVDKAEYNGENYWHSEASWTNDYSTAYKGALQIKLDLEDTPIIPGSIIVYDRLKNRELSITDWSYSGNTITISYVDIPIGEVTTFDIYFETDVEEQDTFSIWGSWQGLTFVGLAGAIALALGIWGYMGPKDSRDLKYLLCVVIVGIVAYLVILEDLSVW